MLKRSYGNNTDVDDGINIFFFGQLAIIKTSYFITQLNEKSILIANDSATRCVLIN